MPFPVRAIQVDGGAEFEAIFEGECQRRDIKLFVLPPRSPRWFTPTGFTPMGLAMTRKGGCVTNHMDEYNPFTLGKAYAII